MILAGLVALGGVGLGCGDSDSGEQTQATTSRGTTTSRATGTPTTAATVGDANAGRTVFETTCQVCHLAGGTEAGSGPKIVGVGLTADAVRRQVVEPRNAMPPNLVSGKELDDVIAFIVRPQ